MGYESLFNATEIPLDVFRKQIKKFEGIGGAIFIDGAFEKDAIMASLARIDPTLEPVDLNLHADIIIQDQLTSPMVSSQDIEVALKKLYARQRKISYKLKLIFMSLFKRITTPIKNPSPHVRTYAQPTQLRN